ncbi:alpha/beta hydrolase [Dactylosporangium sp. CA-092794]|uniref:alpha/beta hydrolase n=1 Tax=Dactylosporangium sp. CA-092794 TaxID=3239929 RepID=UPI003D8AA1C9
MPLDPRLDPFVEYLRHDFVPIPIEQERASSRATSTDPVGTLIAAPPESVRAATFWIAGQDPGAPIRLRVYRTNHDGTARAGLLFIHGGGWSVGDIESAEPHCAWLAHDAGAVVVSVDYRLAPEHKYPAGLTDVYDALLWVAENADLLGIDPARLAIGGGSAGGNLAAAACLMARDRGGPAIALQLLEVPALDLTNGSPSIHEFDAEFPALGQIAEMLRWRYVGTEEQTRDPYVSPLCAPDLSGLPRAVILSAEVDPARDDAARYAQRLTEAGVPATNRTFEGLLHGADSLTLLLPQAKAWQDAAVAALRTL